MVLVCINETILMCTCIHVYTSINQSVSLLDWISDTLSPRYNQSVSYDNILYIVYIQCMSYSAFNSAMHMIRYAYVLICAVCTAYACNIETTVVPINTAVKLDQAVATSSLLQCLTLKLLVAPQPALSVMSAVHGLTNSMPTLYLPAADHTVAELLRCMHLRMNHI